MRAYQATFKPSKITDPAVKKFVTDITDMVKMNAVQSIMAIKDPSKYKLKVNASTHLANKIMADKNTFKAIPTNKLLTSYLKNKAVAQGIDFTSELYALNQGKVLTRLGIANPSAVNMIYYKIGSYSKEVTHSSNTTKVTKKVAFKLHEVHCVDETNPEPFGSDNIHVFGSFLNDKAAATPFESFKAGNFEDDGTKKKYTPAKQLAFMELDANYPKVLAVNIGIVEKDTDSKLAKALSAVYAAVESDIKEALQKLRAEIVAFGINLGNALGPISSEAGAVLAYVFSEAFDKTVAFFKDLFTFDDDFFQIQTAVLTLDKPTSIFEGNVQNSPIATLRFEGHGGIYDLKYNWEILN
ncbi:MAG: hypothetical protein ACRCYO_12815 [Bacteroidia bacterium]